jgi:hypothetical protein
MRISGCYGDGGTENPWLYAVCGDEVVDAAWLGSSVRIEEEEELAGGGLRAKVRRCGKTDVVVGFNEVNSRIEQLQRLEQRSRGPVVDDDDFGNMRLVLH